MTSVTAWHRNRCRRVLALCSHRLTSVTLGLRIALLPVRRASMPDFLMASSERLPRELTDLAVEAITAAEEYEFC